jgi:hypothetical protein
MATLQQYLGKWVSRKLAAALAASFFINQAVTPGAPPWLPVVCHAAVWVTFMVVQGFLDTRRQQ